MPSENFPTAEEVALLPGFYELASELGLTFQQAEKMRDYALLAVKQERNRTLEIVRQWHTLRDNSGRLSPAGEEIAAAIRQSSQKEQK